MDYGKMEKAELVEELKKLQKQVEKLREADAERQRAEEKIQHLNLVLRAIRNVNQLITKEKDRDKLLKGVCENLVDPLGYFNAWGVVLDDSGKLVTSAESGLGRDFRPIRERLERDELTRCGEKALKQSGIVATHNPPSACADCPLSQKYHSRGALTIRLEHGRKVYGLLSASVPAAFAGEKEEHSLFREVANNIAFALHDMELEEERKQMETVLRDREKRYRLLIESLSEGIWVIDAASKTAFVNPPMAKMLGYTVAQMQGKELLSFMAEPAIELCNDYLKRHKQGISEQREFEFLRKDGSKAYLIMETAPITDEKGKYRGAISGVLDVTDRKRAEETTQMLKAEKMVVEKLRKLDRMRDEFVSTITHELRTPMTPLRSTIEMLLDGSLGELTNRQRSFIEMMARNVERLTQFTTEVLTLSRLESGRYKLAPKMLSLREALVAVIELMEQKAQSKNSTVSFDIDAKISAYVDGSSLGIVVTNLTNNAIVHTPEGTEIVVSGRRLDEDFIEVSVADNGQGIPPEALENIFDRFYQAKRETGAGYHGTGVGLAVCKALVEAMGGEISVESHFKEGTVFRFTLSAMPLQEENEEVKE